jgi:hypothetical protein
LQCDPGQYRLAQSHGTPQSSCADCPIGWSQPNDGSASCVPCIPGTYQSQEGQIFCPHCLVNEKSAEITQSTECVTCEAGTYTDSMNASARCLNCPVGTSGIGCQICTPGSYRGSTDSAISCLNCPEGYYQNLAGSPSCFSCIPGKAQNMTNQAGCNTCLANEYAETSASLNCTTCPEGYWTNTRVQSSSCSSCAAGTAGVYGKDCIVCDTGRYRDTNDAANACLDCPAGYSQKEERSPACLKCFPGQYQTQEKSEGCLTCGINEYSSIAAVTCVGCPLGKYTAGADASAACSACPAGTAGAGCVICAQGKYRGTTDEATVCLECVPGQFSKPIKDENGNLLEGQPFCLDCDLGEFQPDKGQPSCISCETGFYKAKKASTEPCNRCENEEEVANEQKSGCVKRDVDPNAAIVTLEGIKTLSADGKFLELTFLLTPTPEATTLTTIETGDRLELQVSPRQDFKKDTTYLKYDLKPTQNKDPFQLVIVVDPIPESNGTIGGIFYETTGLGSAWAQLRYFQAKVEKSEAGGKGRRGPISSRNDAWAIANTCGDDQYLRTHYEDLLTNKPLPLMSKKDSKDENPSCVACPLGANCRGARTWSEVEALPGYRALPWDDRGYGKCPRKPACPGSDEMMVHSTNTFELDGGNSSRVTKACDAAHRGILCAECNNWYDTKLGDNLGLCKACPDQTQNYWRLGGLGLVGVIMMSLLVRDSLEGISKIVTGVSKGEDTPMPFHSVGIRIISSYMQVAGLLNNFRLELPQAVTSLITVQSAASGVGGAVISFNCLVPDVRGSELFVFRLMCIVIIIPGAAILTVILFWSLRAICHKTTEPIITVHGHKYHNATPKDKMIGTMVVLFYLMFPSILSGITTAMSCTTYGEQGTDLTRVLLDASLDIPCYKTVHLALLVTILLPSFALFAFIAPATVVLAMRSHYKAQTLLPHQSDFHPKACYRYGFLFLGYEQEFYGWEVFVMLRKAAFVITSGLLRPYGPVAQVVGASIILITSLSIHLQKTPYDSKGHDYMETISLHCGLLILMFVLLTSIVGQDVSGKLGPISTVALIIVVFGSTIFFFVSSFVLVMSNSHDNKSVIGAIARTVTRRSKLGRRHSINPFAEGLAEGKDSNRGVGGTRRRVGGRVVPRSFTLQHVRKAVVEDKTQKIEVAAAIHKKAFQKTLQQRGKSAKSRTQRRLRERLKMKARRAKVTVRRRSSGNMPPVSPRGSSPGNDGFLSNRKRNSVDGGVSLEDEQKRRKNIEIARKNKIEEERTSVVVEKKIKRKKSKKSNPGLTLLNKANYSAGEI